jgi:hypothetical protein
MYSPRAHLTCLAGSCHSSEHYSANDVGAAVAGFEYGNPVMDTGIWFRKGLAGSGNRIEPFAPLQCRSPRDPRPICSRWCHKRLWRPRLRTRRRTMRSTRCSARARSEKSWCRLSFYIHLNRRPNQLSSGPHGTSLQTSAPSSSAARLAPQPRHPQDPIVPSNFLAGLTPPTGWCRTSLAKSR